MSALIDAKPASNLCCSAQAMSELGQSRQSIATNKMYCRNGQLFDHLVGTCDFQWAATHFALPDVLTTGASWQRSKKRTPWYIRLVRRGGCNAADALIPSSPLAASVGDWMAPAGRAACGAVHAACRGFCSKSAALLSPTRIRTLSSAASRNILTCCHRKPH